MGREPMGVSGVEEVVVKAGSMSRYFVPLVAVVTLLVPKGMAAGPSMRFELADGTVLTGASDAEVITVRMAGDNVLNVPVTELRHRARIT